MRHFFKSTYGQLTFMFGLLLLVNFVVIILSLRELSFKPAASQFAMFISNQIKAVKPLLIDKEFGAAQNTLNSAFPQHNIILQKQVTGKPLPNLVFYQTLLQHLQSNQDQSMTVLLQESESTSRIWIQPQWLKGHWLGISFQSFVSQVPQWLAFIFISLLLLSLLAAFVFSRYMLKPFKNLAQMASDVVLDRLNPDEIKIQGTIEVQEISGLVKNSVNHIQQLNKEKEMLLAGVSHDLRTPLARMRLQAEFLTDTEYRDTMIAEIKEMDAIIGDFVAYVRSGSYEETQSLNIITLVQESIEPFKNNDNFLAFDAQNRPIDLNTKPLCLKRMLSNIYDNAIKYGKPPISIELEESDLQIIIKVIDHGKGLSEQELESVFEPFVMAQSTDNQYGSGLGLSIVKKMAEQINATVYAENHPTAGLCVCIQINKNYSS